MFKVILCVAALVAGGMFVFYGQPPHIEGVAQIGAMIFVWGAGFLTGRHETVPPTWTVARVPTRVPRPKNVTSAEVEIDGKKVTLAFDPPVTRYGALNAISKERRKHLKSQPR